MNPRVGVPTSVLLMTIVSIAGFIDFGLLDGQLLLERSGDTIVAIGGEAIAPLASDRFDLTGMWLAAVPVVAWGAPLGSLVASRVTDRQLVSFVVVLALAEVVSTVLFLEPLRTDLGLALFGAIGLVLVTGGLLLLQRHRVAILGLPPIDESESFVRGGLDVGNRFREQLRQEDQR